MAISASTIAPLDIPCCATCGRTYGWCGHTNRAGAWASLSPAELRVAELLTRGCSNAEMGRELFNSEHTVKVHVSTIIRKLGVANRTEAAVVASRMMTGAGR